MSKQPVPTLATLPKTIRALGDSCGSIAPMGKMDKIQKSIKIK